MECFFQKQEVPFMSRKPTVICGVADSPKSGCDGMCPLVCRSELEPTCKTMLCLSFIECYSITLRLYMKMSFLQPESN